jgi:uncharacterized repeat protein (TIGR04076 family)
MFQIKATVIGFKGDEEKYPCHFQHKVGDQFVWDGERFIGRICPFLASTAIPRILEMSRLGPRAVSPAWYSHFWYTPLSVRDPSYKKYDGVGFRNVLDAVPEAPYHMSSLQPEGAFTWPPLAERTIGKENIVMCGDTRTSLLLKLEAFDLCDNPYFRRQMSILNKVSAKPGILVDRILGEFSKDEIEIPFPALGKVIVELLVEELALIGYLVIADGKATVTESGQAKLGAFKKGLLPEEHAALNM